MAAKTVKQQEETTPAATTGNDAVNNPETEGEGQQTAEPEDIVNVLIAQTYILHNSKHYKPGDVLPANDPDMLAAWIEAGTAAWVDARELEHEKAVPVTAIPGIYGSSTSSDSDNGENLVGRVPANSSRNKK